ncbi:MAG: hypothetical protein PHQ97_13055 [Desulfobacterales bacterium]|nr:hypothetical protein [Desulfobacterales bacterium]
MNLDIDLLHDLRQCPNGLELDYHMCMIGHPADLEQNAAFPLDVVLSGLRAGG